MLFQDRRDAGRKLAEALKQFSLDRESLILGLPRGGVVVASAVAKILNLSLDIIAPRKIGAPSNPELAIGAIAGDETYLIQDLIDSLGVSPTYLEREIAKEKQEAKRRMGLYRQGRGPLLLRKKTVIVVDDGIATGATMLAAIRYLQKQGVSRCIAAVPVAPVDAAEKIRKEGAEAIILFTPTPFFAVGQFYLSFLETPDSEVISLLNHSAVEG